MFTTANTSSQCRTASDNGLAACTNRTGALCVFQNITEQPYECVLEVGIGRDTSDGTLLCANLTSVEYCPAGHYCLSGTASKCDSGYFCPEGTAYPYKCPFPLLACSENGTAYPHEGVVFLLLIIIFCTILSLYWAFGKYRISDRKWDAVGSAMATKNHDAVNVVNMEHDQAVIVNAMDDIFTSMAARERAVATGKWDNIIDEDTMEAVSRFSEAFYMRESELGHAPVQISAPVVRTAAHATHAPTAAAAAVPPPPLGAPADASPKSSLKNNAKSNPKRGSAPDISRATMGGIGRRKSGAARMKQNSIARQGSKLLSNLEASMAHFEYDEVKVPLTVTFTHMHLNLKPSNTPILSDVCVSIKPFHVTAIMGPSGAGKTSLLSLLRGQAHYATIEGEITVNGHEVGSLEPFKHQTAYVPQDDIVNDDLSVEDNILYSALLFNRRGFLYADEVMPMVIRAEKLLDISHIRTSVVGNASKRGISGGQKKRVSIGMELMKEAELFFLDEPTSGLDSASSMLVVNALHFLASKGVTVSTTIHQPRQEILNLMDNLLLLAPGGRVAYFGPIIDVHEHFSRLDFTCPVGTNIADFVMDTLCGFVLADGEDQVWEVKRTIGHICDWWAEHKYPDFGLSIGGRLSMMKENCDLSHILKPTHSEDPALQWRYGLATQSLKVFAASFDRQVKTNFRTLDTISTTCALLLVFGVIVAFLSGPLALDGTASGISSFSAQITSGALVFSLLVQAASLRLLSADQLLRDREFRAGVLIAPYYLGKVLGNYCEACLYAFAFLVGYYPFLKARAPFVCYWYVFFLLHLAISGMVNFIVIAYPSTNKATFSVGCVVLLWSFGGVSPPLSEMQASMGTFATVINTISPFRYSYEAEVVNELSRYPTIWNTASLYNKLGFHPRDRDDDVAALIVYFVLANVMAYVWAEVVYSNPRILKNMKERLDVLYENTATDFKRRLNSPAGDESRPTLTEYSKTDPPARRESEDDQDEQGVVARSPVMAPPKRLNPTKGVKFQVHEDPARAGYTDGEYSGSGSGTMNPLSTPQPSPQRAAAKSQDGFELSAKISPSSSTGELA